MLKRRDKASTEINQETTTTKNVFRNGTINLVTGLVR